MKVSGLEYLGANSNRLWVMFIGIYKEQPEYKNKSYKSSSSSSA